ncbi:hypothetical protein [Terricaulis silvestris]|uniref:Uncharacterized protein n=1 Tax=Terricaulis silvestris TaxID=2686094 RepID=A0A6I6MGJ3_9CAUL|nr:hypothetical protein [Terricaulis silvestris]QGZ93409.1 hypothetical protein DSM104635_00219 [Terricaulis silvestris]
MVEPEDRREFLKTAGKFAIIVPPAMTFLLSTTLSSPAIAQSGGGGSCNSGNGNGPEFDENGNECDPGNSGDNNMDNTMENMG